MLYWIKNGVLLAGAAAVIPVATYVAGALNLNSVSYSKLHTATSSAKHTEQTVADAVPSLNTEEYDARLLALADYVPTAEVASGSTTASTTTATTTVASPLVYSSSTNVTITGNRWPAAAPYPQPGALLPFQRILAYYGNFYSRRMGILGELDPAEMLAHLASTTKQWEAADPDTPVLPAIEYIASVAQGSAGADGMYRNVMPKEEIKKAHALAKQIDGILILDIQIGRSSLPQELPKFRSYLSQPDVHLAIDPEFSMKHGRAPGTVIGTHDATDVNYAIEYLAELVREYELPPKVLIIHRFTQGMVTNYADIKPRPEVQVVMNMDGWGSKALKRSTYRRVIEPEPVQFTGVKLFYKNDLKAPSTGLLTPEEVLRLHPEPIYVQYQ